MFYITKSSCQLYPLDLIVEIFHFVFILNSIRSNFILNSHRFSWVRVRCDTLPERMIHCMPFLQPSYPALHLLVTPTQPLPCTSFGRHFRWVSVYDAVTVGNCIFFARIVLSNKFQFSYWEAAKINFKSKSIANGIFFFRFRTTLASMLVTCRRFRISHSCCTAQAQRPFSMRQPSSRWICDQATGNSCIHSRAEGKCLIWKFKIVKISNFPILLFLKLKSKMHLYSSGLFTFQKLKSRFVSISQNGSHGSCAARRLRPEYIEAVGECFDRNEDQSQYQFYLVEFKFVTSIKPLCLEMLMGECLTFNVQTGFGSQNSLRNKKKNNERNKWQQNENKTWYRETELNRRCYQLQCWI